MTSRERVLLAVNHQEPDRLPVFEPNLIPMYKPLDERVQSFLDTFEFDRFEGVGGLRWSPSQREDLPDETSEDAYGCRFQYKGVGSPYCIHHPLAQAETVRDVEQFDWPDPEEHDLVAEGARERAKTARDRGEYVTAAGVEMLFHRYHFLRGFEQWMIDLKTNQAVHQAIAEHIHHINSTLVLRALEEVGEYVDLISTGDDFGTSTASYMSPGDFRALIKPYFKDLIGRIKSRFPQVKVYLHSHGQIMDLVPDLIDCGFDILNPILPLDNMDPVRLKREFGAQLAFQGGIDIERILPFGTVDEVRAHVKDVIDILGPGGGFMFKAQAISRLVPYENLIAAYEIALEYGRYGA